MASPQQSRILRVGLVQDGRIIEERHLLRPGDFTVGQDAKNSLVLPLSEDMPASLPIFEYRAHQYHLVLTDGLQGRVNLGSSDVDFQTLRTQGLAQPRGDQHVLPLQESARGQVEFDEHLRLFFQFVPPPSEVEKPRLPPELQGGLWRGMDRIFFAILVAVLLLHLAGAALIIASTPPPEPELSLDELPDRFARVLIPPKLEQPPKPPADPSQAAPTSEKPKASDPGEKPAADDSTPANAQEAAARRAEMVKKLEGKGLLKILGSSGSGAGAFADVLGGSTGGGDIASALAGAGGVGIATEATEASMGPQGPRGGGTGKVAGIGALGTSGGGQVDLGSSKKEVQVSGHVTSSPPEVESSDVDRDELARYVKARIKSIQSCYEKELKRNPHLKGKVMVRFNILPSGRAGELDIEENTLGNDAVASCIRTVIRNWVFPFKPDGEVPVAYPFVFAPAG
jgi:hypothetical protein